MLYRHFSVRRCLCGCGGKIADQLLSEHCLEEHTTYKRLHEPNLLDSCPLMYDQRLVREIDLSTITPYEGDELAALPRNANGQLLDDGLFRDELRHATRRPNRKAA